MKWYTASETGFHDFSGRKKTLAEKMTSDEIAQAEQRAMEFVRKHPTLKSH